MAALYALFLQAFLGALQPVASLADPASVICAEQGPANGPSDDHSVPCRQHDCCLPMAASHTPLVPAPSVAIAVAWPSREAVRLAWQPSDAVMPRAPPDPTTNPRGPPAA
ncbi:hypothetical protein HCU64_23565 [Methylobacterium sp. C25]|uniref:hypothetical protein n=1 Tax=Methylobacterium sp. C25 TaxID=2721622 RepID=UPI001F331118|nr:hypothetical protein [Methylobacterium sp. C25]MCE4226725.1 hypothetical protein [Methylobacterium sp. C25]